MLGWLASSGARILPALTSLDPDVGKIQNKKDGNSVTGGIDLWLKLPRLIGRAAKSAYALPTTYAILRFWNFCDFEILWNFVRSDAALTDKALSRMQISSRFWFLWWASAVTKCSKASSVNPFFDKSMIFLTNEQNHQSSDTTFSKLWANIWLTTRQAKF